MITLRRQSGYRVVLAWLALLLAPLLAAALAGCGRSPGGINTVYGRRSGNGASSVNGTSVLARMFQNADHRLVTRGRTGGRIEDCKVIVWAPDRFTPPTKEERNAIQAWLGEERGRTFIYIGRDYDASIDYWRHAADSLLADESAAAETPQAEEYLRRRAEDTARFESARTTIPKDEDAAWFVVSRDHPRQRVTNLAGPWSRGINPAAAAIRIRSRFDVPEKDPEEPDYYQRSLTHQVLLSATETADPAEAENDPLDPRGGFQASDGAPLITRVSHPYWNDGAIIVVTNGSFLLNLPLVNHEHRKLAARMVDECGSEPARVAFWEGDAFVPSADSAEQQHQWMMLTIWPTNFILLHLGVLGVMYIMWKYPIFGPAKDLPPPATSDFANHINAMGELMAATNEVGYARAKLQNYRVHVRGETREADTPLTRSPRLDAASLEFQTSEAMAEYRRGDFSEALRLVNRMLDAQPQRSVLWQFKGECLFKLQRYDEALACFQQLQTVGGPQAGEAFLWISLCQHNAGRTREAKNVLQQFISNSREDADPELLSKAKAALGKLESVKT